MSPVLIGPTVILIALAAATIGLVALHFIVRER